MTDSLPGGAPLLLGRYALYDELASGGMATVHLGRLLGPVGFARTVAIKRLHPQHAKDPEFVAMFLDEARLAARIRHPNVVATLDVVATTGEVFLVMEYISGESMAALLGASFRASKRVPMRYAVHMVSGALQGLHAAHEATNDKGESLHIVHRDVSPHNILVGTDGVARVLDFGVAKAAGRLQTTDEGRIKGKLAYMAPEQLSSQAVSARTDLFAASVVLWEALAGRRLFPGADPAEIVGKVLNAPLEPPSLSNAEIPKALDEIVLKGLSRDPDQRFASAHEMAEALDAAVGLVSPREVGAWVKTCVGERLSERSARIAEIERSSSSIEVQGEPRAADVLARFSPRPTQASMETLPASGTGRSQIGSVVEARDSMTTSPRSRWVVPLLGGAALIVAVVGGIALASRKPAPEAAVATTAVATVVAPSPSPSASASPREPEPVASTPPPPAAPASASSAPAAPSPSVKKIAPRGPAPKKPAEPIYTRD
ncbi:MAG: serine/threonine protein kinase [Myxococcales bacterium]|nr:serine/threonine protein kinase [Myxococcales bacterium]